MNFSVETREYLRSKENDLFLQNWFNIGCYYEQNIVNRYPIIKICKRWKWYNIKYKNGVNQIYFIIHDLLGMSPK